MRQIEAPGAETKLTRTEFAVIRAYAQGMSPLDIAHRYLTDPDDDEHLTESEAIRRIMALRDRLVQFALQHSRPDIAQMFEALRARSDVGMTRRVDALTSLEGLGQTRPQPEHDVGLWFGPSLSRRLASAGVRRIADLVELVNARGTAWWRRTPGVGPASAEIVTRWLLARQTQGIAGPNYGVKPYVRPPSEAGTIIAGPSLMLAATMPYPVPLERMLSPADGPLSRDLRDIRHWLGDRPRSANTIASYRREAERLLLWMARNGLSLDALTAGSLTDFGRFLQAPVPVDFWCGPAAMRSHLHWRPFEGPLSAASASAALRVIGALLRARARTAGAAAVNAANVAVASARTRTDLGLAAQLEPRRPAGKGPAGRHDASLSQIEAFMAWQVAAHATSARHRAALLAACLVRHEGFRLQHIPHILIRDLDDDVEVPAWRDGQAQFAVERDRGQRRIRIPRSGAPLHPTTAFAVRQHRNDRSEAGLPAPDGGALLGPLAYPPTRRGRNKRSQQPEAGYSPAGIEKLLRWSWEQFAASTGLQGVRFTPKRLQATSDGTPADDTAAGTAGSSD